MTEIKQEREIEYEIIPVTLGVAAMLQKIIDWRNFFMQLAIEHGMRVDGIDPKEGWQIHIPTGTWRRPKRPEASDATTGIKE